MLADHLICTKQNKDSTTLEVSQGVVACQDKYEIAFLVSKNPLGFGSLETSNSVSIKV